MKSGFEWVRANISVHDRVGLDRMRFEKVCCVVARMPLFPRPPSYISTLSRPPTPMTRQTSYLSSAESKRALPCGLCRPSCLRSQALPVGGIKFIICHNQKQTTMKLCMLYMNEMMDSTNFKSYRSKSDGRYGISEPSLCLSHDCHSCRRTPIWVGGGRHGDLRYA